METTKTSNKTRQVGAMNCEGHAVVLTQPLPSLAAGQVLVQVHASLISAGTELVQARRLRVEDTHEPSDPTPFGYQAAGIVQAVSDDVTQHRPGDRVLCMGAGYALHSDYAVVPQNLCFTLPDDLPFDRAVYAVLGATAMHAIQRGGTALGEYLLVAGLGIVGQLAGQLGKLSGMQVMGWDL